MHCTYVYLCKREKTKSLCAPAPLPYALNALKLKLRIRLLELLNSKSLTVHGPYMLQHVDIIYRYNIRRVYVDQLQYYILMTQRVYESLCCFDIYTVMY